mmetsp:Transcript_25438/g.55231  ORF Transcript_25438/g.55231 Transcript_25438/m.55231 type:complete len:328 (+) Transcript_25438:710-1693(+)
MQQTPAGKLPCAVQLVAQNVSAVLEHSLHVQQSCPCLLEERVDDALDVELLEIHVGLAAAHKHDGRTAAVHHGHCCANLVVNRVKLGQHDAVDDVLGGGGRGGQVIEGSVELDQLIHCVIADQRLANKEHEVGLVDVDEVAEGAHERLVVLHASCSVHQHHVPAVTLSLLHCLKCHLSRILLVAALIQRHLQASAMSLELLNRTCTEGITGRNGDLDVVLAQPVRNLCEVGRLADSVDAAEDNHVGLASRLRLADVQQDVDLPLVEDACQCVLKRAPHEGADPREAAQLLTLQRPADRVADVLCDLLGHIALHELALHVCQCRSQVL